MTAAAVLESIQDKVVERAERDRTLARIGGVFCPRRSVVTRLVRYYAPDSEHCGTSFLDGTECDQPGTITPADLFALTALGLTVRPAASRRLLHDTAHARRIEAALAPDRLPLNATLTDPGTVRPDAMLELHDAVLAAVEGTGDRRTESLVLTSALCARKRPELFAVLDPQFVDALQLPGAAHPLRSWRILAHVLAQPWVLTALADTFDAAATERPSQRFDIYPLRQLHVVATTADR